MLKKLLLCMGLFAITAGLSAGQLSAATTPVRIAVVIKTDQLDLAPTSRNYLSEKLRTLFPTGQYQLLEDKSLNQALDKLLADRMFHDPTKLGKHIFADLAKENGYDATLILFFRFDRSTNNNNFLKWEKEVETTLKARMIITKTTSFIYNNDISRLGATPLKTMKDVTSMEDTVTDSVNRCVEHLFSDLELPLAKRTLELML